MTDESEERKGKKGASAGAGGSCACGLLKVTSRPVESSVSVCAICAVCAVGPPLSSLERAPDARRLLIGFEALLAGRFRFEVTSWNPSSPVESCSMSRRQLAGNSSIFTTPAESAYRFNTFCTAQRTVATMLVIIFWYKISVL